MTDVGALVARLTTDHHRLCATANGGECNCYAAEYPVHVLAREVARLRSLLAEETDERDEWKRKAKIDEQQAADRMENWQVAHEHAVKMTERVVEVEAQLLRAENERDELLRLLSLDEMSRHDESGLLAEETLAAIRGLLDGERVA